MHEWINDDSRAANRTGRMGRLPNFYCMMISRKASMLGSTVVCCRQAGLFAEAAGCVGNLEARILEGLTQVAEVQMPLSSGPRLAQAQPPERRDSLQTG